MRDYSKFAKADAALDPGVLDTLNEQRQRIDTERDAHLLEDRLAFMTSQKYPITIDLNQSASE